MNIIRFNKQPLDVTCLTLDEVYFELMQNELFK